MKAKTATSEAGNAKLQKREFIEPKILFKPTLAQDRADK